MSPDRWQKVKQLYNSALELEPAERESFLREACAGDEDIRKEVERLLGRNAEAEGFLEFPAMEVAAKALARNEKCRAVDPVDSTLIGKTFSHCRIPEKLGKGGMGEVLLAEDTNVNRRVAVKALPNVFAGDAERLARLEREARLLASLNHPNIASIYGLERTDSGPLLVLELIEGETLAKRLAKGAIPAEETPGVCRQIAEERRLNYEG